MTLKDTPALPKPAEVRREPAKEVSKESDSGMIYNIRLNRNEFNKIIEKKAKAKQVEANK
jgi:hypothetical protein